MKIWVLILTIILVPCTTFGQATQPVVKWENISDPVMKSVLDTGIKIPWPGQTAGVCVDPSNGHVIMEVTGIGLYASVDHGDHFAPLASGQISGRCEYGYAFNVDPAGKRFACFMLDGKCGLTLDSGESWNAFAPVGRNWDFGAVDWSDPKAKSMFAIHHESGGEVYYSNDAGLNWKFLGKHPEFTSVGICGDHILLAGTDHGIVRSTDAGRTWNKSSTIHPIGRVATCLKGPTYWLADQGIVVSRDQGASWDVIAAPASVAWGPIFGSDEKEIITSSTTQVFRTKNGGASWETLAQIPAFKEMPPHQPGQFLSIGYDAQSHYLYASRMANPTYRLKLAD